MGSGSFSDFPGLARLFELRIVTRLVLSFLLVILLTSITFSVVGVRVIGDRVVDEAQAKVQTDLNAAREIFLNKLASINDVIRFNSDRFLLMNELLSGNHQQAAEALGRIREREKLDVLTVTDAHGRVLLRTSNPDQVGDDRWNARANSASESKSVGWLHPPATRPRSLPRKSTHLVMPSPVLADSSKIFA